MSDEFKVGDKVRLRLDANDSNFGDRSRKIKTDRTVCVIGEVTIDGFYPFLDGERLGVRWFAEWMEKVPKTIVVVKRKNARTIKHGKEGQDASHP